MSLAPGSACAMCRLQMNAALIDFISRSHGTLLLTYTIDHMLVDLLLNHWTDFVGQYIQISTECSRLSDTQRREDGFTASSAQLCVRGTLHSSAL